MKTVQFSAVPLGGWFKESANGNWHLKVSASKGMYQSFGTRYEPAFKAEEPVLVD
jgi:hypothetical protein